MAETLQQYTSTIDADDGMEYEARACGALMTDGLWHGWIEFVPIGGGEALRSPRETTQPNRTDAEYWASGLSRVYLEGALRRALAKPIEVPVAHAPPPIFDGPKPSSAAVAVPPSSVLDPFSVYAKGEDLLRQELGAMSAWHLVNIILDYELSDAPVDRLNRMPSAMLIDLIVEAVRHSARAPSKS